MHRATSSTNHRPAVTWLTLLIVAGILGACGDDAGAGDPDGAVAPDGSARGDAGASGDWYAPDPEGRTTEGNRIEDAPAALVITSDALSAAWSRYVGLRSVLWAKTDVVTVETITASQPGADAAEKLRGYLRERYTDDGVAYVLMAGDAAEVPFRRVDNAITIPGGETYTSNAPSQLYFANVEVDWDADGDGVGGERGDDFDLEEARQTQIAVGRVPTDRVDEVEAYTAKMLRYVTAEQGRVTHPLLLSDVAATVPILGAIDAAEGIEVTYEAFFPPEFKSHVRKIYATAGAADKYGGEEFTKEGTKAALEEGYALVLHNGHGSHGYLTDRLNTDWVNALENELPPVFLSCACLTGNYADVAKYPTCDRWVEQTPDQDSAGERLILNTTGAVAYVGNVQVGLGMLGGAQFLHAMMEGLFVDGLDRIGDTFNRGHARMRSIEWSVSSLPSVMTDESEWWTHHGVILLGDPSLRIWTAPRPRLTLEAPATYGPGFNELWVTVRDEGDQPAAGVTVRLFKADDLYLEQTTGEDGRARFAFVPYGPGELLLGATSPTDTPVYAAVQPVE